MKEIKVVVNYTEGYQKRYTAACLEVLKKRKLMGEKKEMPLIQISKKTEEVS